MFRLYKGCMSPRPREDVTSAPTKNMASTFIKDSNNLHSDRVAFAETSTPIIERNSLKSDDSTLTEASWPIIDPNNLKSNDGTLASIDNYLNNRGDPNVLGKWRYDNKYYGEVPLILILSGEPQRFTTEEDAILKLLLCNNSLEQEFTLKDGRKFVLVNYLLYFAAKNGWLRTLEQLLIGRPDRINQIYYAVPGFWLQASHCITLLSIALLAPIDKELAIKVATFVLNHPAFSFQLEQHKDDPQYTYSFTDPLFNAVALGDIEFLKLYLQKTGDSIHRSSNGENTLYATLDRKTKKIDLDMFNYLLENEVNPYMVADIEAGENFISELIKYDLLEGLKLIDQKDHNKWTTVRTGKHKKPPLIIAAENNSLKVAEYILQLEGYNVNEVDKLKQTPLMYCRNSFRKEMAELLLRYVCNVNAYDVFGATALHRTSENAEAREIAEVLIKHGANCSQKSYSKNQIPEFYKVQYVLQQSFWFGITPLMRSAHIGIIEIFKLILDNVDDNEIDIADDLGRTALFHSISGFDHDDKAEALIKRGANLNIRTRILNLNEDFFYSENVYPEEINHIDGCTPLIKCAVEHANKIAKLLLDNGADPDIANAEGKDAMSVAVTAQNWELVKLLAEHKLQSKNKSTKLCVH